MVRSGCVSQDGSYRERKIAYVHTVNKYHHTTNNMYSTPANNKYHHTTINMYSSPAIYKYHRTTNNMYSTPAIYKYHRKT